jgi:hypothetical protein
LTGALLHKSANIRSRIVDGLAVILDIRSGSYIVLDKVATTMWRALMRVPADERVETLCAKFDAPAERVANDLKAFTADCLDRGLVSVTPPVMPRPVERAGVPRSPTAWLAWRMLLATTFALRFSTFQSVYLRYAALARRDPPLDANLILHRAESAFVKAETFFVIRTAPKDCLPRSLALYRFLLAAGLEANHCIGVNRFPFMAHAWVETGNSPVLDQTSKTRHYAELARI